MEFVPARCYLKVMVRGGGILRRFSQWFGSAA
jgi:hypothetical protein